VSVVWVWLFGCGAPPRPLILASSLLHRIATCAVGKFWIGFEAVERLGIWSCMEASTVQHGTTRSTLEGAPESLPISSHSGGSPRSSLTSRFSPLISHLSPLTSRSSVKRRPRPVGDPAERSSPESSSLPFSLHILNFSEPRHAQPSPMQLRNPSVYYGTSPCNNTESSRRFPWRRRRRPQKAKLPCLIGRSPAT
jgi:hypothetical protein